MIHRAVSASLFFDKKALKMCLIILIITPFCIGQPIVCNPRNISCVKDPDGFNFPHECPEGSEISIEANETVIASSESPNRSADVLRMDNNSVTIKYCQDLRVKCIILDRKGFVKETCLDFKMTSNCESSDPIDPLKPWGYIGIGVGAIILIAAGFGIFCWSYISWKKEGRRQQEATTPGYLQYLLTCFGLRKGTFLAERGEREIRHSEGTELQEVTHGDTETQQNGDVRNVTHHDRDPHGSGENEAGEENPLGNGHVHCDDISAPKVNGESRHRALNRNPRDDDPGGEKSNERKDTIRKMASGWTVGDHNAEDHETERRPLLPPNQRAAIQGFDMTGEATALVNKPGFDPDHVSGCSVAPETDVESTHNMKN